MPSDLADSPTRPAIEYEHPAAFPRRQFRLLLVLTFINTLLLAGFVCGPAISTFARTTWTDWQAKRQTNQKLQQQQSLLRQAAQFTAPADQVIYEEHPRDAAKLLDGGAFTTIPFQPPQSFYITPEPWQPPVFRDMPPAVAQLHNAVANKPPSGGTLFLHTLRAPDGGEHLVWVLIVSDQRIGFPEGAKPSDSPRRFSVRTERRIQAYVVDKNPNTSQRPLLWLDVRRQSGALEPLTRQRTTEVTWTKADNWENGTVDVRPAGLFRFYAGQVDPKDASHFTIDYALDGQRGTIDGYLKAEDRLLLVPRAGRIIGGGSTTLVWDPFAAPPTQPTKP